MGDSNRVDGSIVGELLLGELHQWYAGICTIRVQGEYVEVKGEAGVARISTDCWRESPLDGEQVKDLSAIAEKVNEAVEEEHAAL